MAGNNLEYLLRLKTDQVDSILKTLKNTLDNFRPAIKASIDTSQIEAKIANVKNSLNSLKADKIQLSIDEKIALSKIQKVELEIIKLRASAGGVTPEIQIKIDQANLKIETLRNKIASLQDKTVFVNIKTEQSNNTLSKLGDDLKNAGIKGGQALGGGINDGAVQAGSKLTSGLKTIAQIAIGNTIGAGLSTTFALGTSAIKGFVQGATNQFDIYKKAVISIDILSPKFNIDAGKAKQAATDLAKELRIGIGTSAESLQNLFKSGLNLDQSTDLLRRFNNEAITGKSVNVSLDDAIRNLSFGYNTQNSVIGNLSGITENYSDIQQKGLKILQERGKLVGLSLGQLDEAQKKEAQYAGIIELTNLTMDSSKQFIGTRVDNQLILNKVITDGQLALGAKFDPFLNEVLIKLTPIIEAVIKKLDKLDLSQLTKFVREFNIKPIVDAIENFDLDKFLESLKSMKKTAQDLIPIIGGLATALAVFAIGSSITAGIALLGDAVLATGISFTFASGSAFLLGGAISFLLSPVFLIALGIGLLVGVLILLYQNWDTVTAFLQSTWSTVSKFLVDSFNSLKDTISKFAGDIGKFFTDGFKNVLSSVTTTFENVKNAVVKFAQDVGKFFTDGFNNVKNSITTTFDNIKNSVLDFISQVLTNFSKFAGDVFNKISDAFAPARSIFKNIFTIFNDIITFGFAFIQGLFATAILTIIAIVTGDFGKIQGIWENLFKFIKDLVSAFSTSVGNQFNQITATIKSVIDGFAKGVSDTWNSIVNTILGIVGNLVAQGIILFNDLKRQGTEIFQGLQNKILEAFLFIESIPTKVQEFIQLLVKKFEELRSQAIGIFQDLQKKLIEAFEFVQTIPSKVAQFVDTVVAKFFELKDRAVKGVEELPSKIVKIFEDLKKDAENTVKNLINSIGDLFKQIKLPELKFPEIKLPEVPKFGGNYTGTTNWQGGITEIAERGREMFRTPDGSVGMAETRGFLNLPKGTEIFDNQDTEKQLKTLSMPTNFGNYKTTNNNQAGNTQSQDNRTYNKTVNYNSAYNGFSQSAFDIGYTG